MDIKTRVIVIILVIAAIVAVGVYFGFQTFYFKKTPAENAEETAEEVKPPSENLVKPESEKSSKEIKNLPPALMSGYKLYKNTEFGFEIQYPISWIVSQEIRENVRGEMVKEFYFNPPVGGPNSDLRFAVLPRDGLSYGVGAKGTSTPVFIGGFSGMQTQYILKDGRRLWLIFPRYGLNNWLEDLGRLDVMTSIENVENDTQIFEQMLNSFKLFN